MAEAGDAGRVVVIGVGNALRGDDAVGLEIVRRMRRIRIEDDPARIELLEQEGEPLGLLEQWRGAHAAVLLDAVQSGEPPGTVHRMDVSAQPLSAELRGSPSTHAVGVGDAIELARALEQLPPYVVVYGVEGRSFDAGSGLSAEVGAVIPELAEEVWQEACRLAG